MRQVYIRVLFAAAIVFIVASMAAFHADCVSQGMKTVRGVFWLECVQK